MLGDRRRRRPQRRRPAGRRRGAGHAAAQPPADAWPAEVRQAARWIRSCFATMQVDLDGSLQSMQAIDRVFDRHVVDGQPRASSPLRHEFGSVLFALGCYVGEVLRRRCGGHWQPLDNKEEPWMAELHFPDGGVCWPIARVIKRSQEGPSESIAVFVQVLIDQSQDG